jgi:signal peptidase II
MAIERPSFSAYPGAAARAAIVAVTVIVVDQVTKALVRADIPVGSHREITSFLDLVDVRNDGVAFSAFGGSPGIVVGLIAIALVALLWYFGTHAGKPFVWLATGLLFGGALGNIIDRVLDGAVTDFIKFSHWPAFNVADIAINVGVVVLVIALLREDGSRGTGQPS